MISDSVISAPTDYVTLEKGFSNLLVQRKKRIINFFYKFDNLKDEYSKILLFLVTAPYMAYSTFHPGQKKVEQYLENVVRGKLRNFKKQEEMVEHIRIIRDDLHKIRIPIQSDNMFSVFRNVEIKTIRPLEDFVQALFEVGVILTYR